MKEYFIILEVNLRRMKLESSYASELLLVNKFADYHSALFSIGPCNVLTVISIRRNLPPAKKSGSTVSHGNLKLIHLGVGELLVSYMSSFLDPHLTVRSLSVNFSRIRI